MGAVDEGLSAPEAHGAGIACAGPAAQASALSPTPVSVAARYGSLPTDATADAVGKVRVLFAAARRGPSPHTACR
jgi:hypothetical protein